MSRIDDALRISEGGAGTLASVTSTIKPVHPSPLNQYKPEVTQYKSEETDGHPHDAAVAEPAKVPMSFRAATPVRRTASPGSTLISDSKLEARLVNTTEHTVAVEQYRRVAAVLHEHQAEGKLKSVMITSALPHDGKTLTVVNLALTLSDSYGRRVLVIDADLRWPSLHTILGIKNERGLSEALRQEQGDVALVQVNERLSALTAGRPGPTPLAGLSSQRMADLLQQCAANFDWVLVDSPPVGVLPDAQVLARLVGGVIMVIGAGSTPAAAVERAIAELGGPEPIIGTILNRVDEHRIPEVSYYGQYRTSTDRR